ncbi:MAG: nucleotidyl transferase AbiEii/AbiGii toxin family protein [bacterium]|nr:nucleotidyl transferase AbiEii/AbiGii toxin family protein [bacterium]
MLPAEGFQPTLQELVDVLDRLGIRFHLTGGIVSVVYGEPRMTQDVDVVLDPQRTADVAEEFLRSLETAGFHFEGETAQRAIRHGEMFQLLDIERVIKLDLYVRCLIPGELERSVRAELFPGMTIPVVARADAALSKLIWIDRGSHRSRRDLRRLLDTASVEERNIVLATADSMGLSELLDDVLSESDEIDA